MVLPDPAESPLAFLDRAALVERRQRLHAILPKRSPSVLFCDHIEAVGEELFALACKRDLEGIVAKHKFGPYLQDSAQWFKIPQPEVFAVGRSGEVLPMRARSQP